MAAKIRKLAMYAQQLAATGITVKLRSRQVDALRMEMATMTAKIRKSAKFAQQLPGTVNLIPCRWILSGWKRPEWWLRL